MSSLFLNALGLKAGGEIGKLGNKLTLVWGPKTLLIKETSSSELANIVLLLYKPNPLTNAKNNCFLTGFTDKAEACNIPLTAI